MNTLKTQSDDYFQKNWEIYKKVVVNNYMEHREFSSALYNFLNDYCQTPFSLLELGCGDATLTVQALLNTTIASYTGVDLSGVALEIAKVNMVQIQCEQTFIEDDISKVVEKLAQNQKQSFDVVMTSFVLHHLSLAEKDKVIQQVSHLLKPNGVFVLIDTVLKKEEDRKHFINRYLENMYQNWNALSSQDMLMIDNHISTYDFPESQTTFYELAEKHNFVDFKCLYKDTIESAQFLCLYK
jgi:SAM-dependent methyltransferase